MRDLDRFIDVVRLQIRPEGRGRQMAVDLEALFRFVPEDVTLADLAAGWRVLARPQGPHEVTPVAHRREVCAQLSAIAMQMTAGPGSLNAALKTWTEWRASFQEQADPGGCLLARTLARELHELESGSYPVRREQPGQRAGQAYATTML